MVDLLSTAVWGYKEKGRRDTYGRIQFTTTLRARKVFGRIAWRRCASLCVQVACRVSGLVLSGTTAIGRGMRRRMGRGEDRRTAAVIPASERDEAHAHQGRLNIEQSEVAYNTAFDPMRLRRTPVGPWRRRMADKFQARSVCPHGKLRAAAWPRISTLRHSSRRRH
jgi:hypothetical protein